MPIHDWTRVDAGIFHGLHLAWINHLSESLNGGLLPPGYYALPEQHGRRLIADILTLQAAVNESRPPSNGGVVTVTEAPPRVSRKLVMSGQASYRQLRRTLAIRHVSHHRIVALVEIVSPANKDRPKSIEQFVDKARAALAQGIHLLVIDLLPAGACTPRELHEAIWGEDADEETAPWPKGKPLLLAAYEAGSMPEAYLEPLAVGDRLIDMPLFLEPGEYINAPLEATYQAAYHGLPAYWREVIEGKREGQ
jgi:hypothetical protein